MSITLLDARRALLKAVPDLGATYTITALATGSVTVGALANSNFPTNKFRNRILWRGEAASAADNLRYGGAFTNTTGLIAHTGANYSDTTITNEEVEIWEDPEIRPDIHINPMFGDALDQLRLLCRVPLAHGPIDYDMQANGVTNWTASSGTPFAKQTTAAEVIMGARSGAFTDGGSGGDYTQSALLPLGQGRQAYLRFIAKADTGTGTFSLVDGSGNIQDSIATTQEDWVYGTKLVSFDSTDEQLRVRITGTTASAQIDVQGAWFVKPDQYYFNLSLYPGWITSLEHVVGVSVGRPRVAGTESDTYLFGSMGYTRLIEGQDFYFQRMPGDANPKGVYINDPSLMGEALFLDVSCPASRPYGVAAAFSAETDTTVVNQNTLLAQMKILLAERYPAKYGYLGGIGAREKMMLLGQEMYTPAQPRRSGWQRGAFA